MTMQTEVQMRQVGAKIRRLRQERDWTGAQLAVYAGMAPSAISQIETGRRSPNAGSLEKIARSLQVEVVDLFETEEYGAILKEKGFPREQIAAWLAHDAGDKEFIARELEKMSEQDFRKKLLAEPPLRRIRDYYRDNDTGASTPRSKPA